MATAFVIFYPSSAYLYNFGYGATPLDVSQVVLYAIIQLVLEFVVDVVCTWYEETRHKVPIRDVWWQLGLWRWTKALPVLMMVDSTIRVLMVSFAVKYSSSCPTVASVHTTMVHICHPDCVSAMNYPALIRICNGTNE